MLHAGVALMWTVQDTLNYSAEVEYALQDSSYPEYLQHRYGDTPVRWYSALSGLDRLRVITNYLTRIRFCDAIGTMRLNIKEGLWAAPVGYKPWYYYEKIPPGGDYSVWALGGA